MVEVCPLWIYATLPAHLKKHNVESTQFCLVRLDGACHLRCARLPLAAKAQEEGSPTSGG